MADADTLLARLRDDDRHLARFVELLLDDILSRRVDELVDPAWLAEQLVQGFRSSADDERTTEWVRTGVQQARARLGQESGPLSERVAPELVAPIKDLVRRPYLPDQAIVRALFDHTAFRGLVRELLSDAIRDYASKLKVPDSAKRTIGRTKLGRTRLGQWAEVAQTAAKMVGTEVERQMEGRVREYVDGAITRAVDVSVRHVCDRSNAQDFGDWRADSIDVLLDVSVERWQTELDKLEPEDLVDDIAAMLRAVAHSDALTGQVHQALELVVTEAGNSSARDFLEGSGLEEGWRPQLELVMGQRAKDFVSTPAFATWLGELCED